MNISLYELIKKTSQQKGRPIKVICDWDEVLKPMKVRMIYNKTTRQIPFGDFYKKYWANAEMVRYRESGEVHSSVKLVESIINNKNFTMCKSSFCDTCETLKKDMKSNPDFYKKSPFLSPAEELLMASKNNLISELVVISSYRISQYKHTSGDPRKISAFTETFGKFPNTKLNLIALKKGKEVSLGKTSPLRWQWIHDNHSNFDLYIDDDVRSILRTREKFLKKTYALPDYKESMKAQAPNIYHL